MLADELTAWAQTDLVAAYRALVLLLHWPDETAVTCVRDDGSNLQAVAIRWDPGARYPGPARLYYASRTGESLEAAIALVPPEPGCLIFAPSTDAHESLLSLQPVTRHSDYCLYGFTGAQAPQALRSVRHISADEAPGVGLEEPWDWPSILGRLPAERPIHCIVQEGQAVAVAAAGSRTALTEEARGVWVLDRLRRQGYGRAVVASATADIMSRGRLPVYGTSADNVASQRLAESVGYARLGGSFKLEYGESRDAHAGRE